MAGRRAPNAALLNFLGRLSSVMPMRRSNSDILKEWDLVEVKDVRGNKRGYICPCGRTGLRYLCFIRNRKTRKTTYVGSGCMKFFTNRMVTEMFNLVRSHIKGHFVSCLRSQHSFAVTSNCRVVRGRYLLGVFFSSIPLRRVNERWVVTVLIRRNQHTGCIPKLVPGKQYKLELSPVTRGRPSLSRPKLHFYADRVTIKNPVRYRRRHRRGRRS